MPSDIHGELRSMMHRLVDQRVEIGSKRLECFGAVRKRAKAEQEHRREAGPTKNHP
jgi:hypothetical protein